jgi:hypothetical protein
MQSSSFWELSPVYCLHGERHSTARSKRSAAHENMEFEENAQADLS